MKRSNKTLVITESRTHLNPEALSNKTVTGVTVPKCACALYVFIKRVHFIHIKIIKRMKKT